MLVTAHSQDIHVGLAGIRTAPWVEAFKQAHPDGDLSEAKGSGIRWLAA